MIAILGFILPALGNLFPALFGYLGKKQDINLSGFQTAAGADIELAKATLTAQVGRNPQGRPKCVDRAEDHCMPRRRAVSDLLRLDRPRFDVSFRLEHREAAAAVGWLQLDHPVEFYRRVAGRAGPLGNLGLARPPVIYSPMLLALFALALLFVACWIESFDDEPAIANALTLGACFIAAGAFALCFFDYLGPLPIGGGN